MEWPTYSSSEENSDNVTFYGWQIIEKKITKSKVDVTFKDAVEMFKDDIKTLKEHIYIERKVNAYHEIKAFLSEKDLMLHEDFAEIYKITSKMPYKKHISEINVLRYLQHVAILKVLIITVLEMIMLSLLPKVPTTIESRLLVVYKKLSTRSNTCIKNVRECLCLE